MFENCNRCISCGEIIPEGFQVCHNCLEDAEQMSALAEYSRKRDERIKRRKAKSHKLRKIWNKFIDKRCLLSLKIIQKNK